MTDLTDGCTKVTLAHHMAMQYCPKCGQPSNPQALYCSQCGQSLNIATQTTQPKKGRKSNRKGSNESLQMYIGIMALLAFFSSSSLITPGGSGILNSSLGFLLVGFAVIAAAIRTLYDVRLGYSTLQSLTQTLAIGALVFLLIYGIMWFTMYQVSHIGTIHLTRATPTPRR
jgi:hypothetical protein